MENLMIRKALALFAALALLLSAFAFSSGDAHASAPSSDVLVIVAKDVTASSHCHVTYRTNIGTSYEKATNVPCAAGSNIVFSRTLLSIAQSQHLAFVTVSANSQQMNGLIASVRQIAQRGQAPQRIVPSTNCGNSSGVSGGWNSPDPNVYYQAYASYQRTVDCKNTYIYALGIVNNGPGYANLADAEYNGASFDYPGNFGCYLLRRSQYASWNPQATVQYGHGLTWFTITHDYCTNPGHVNQFHSIGYLF